MFGLRTTLALTIAGAFAAVATPAMAAEFQYSYFSGDVFASGIFTTTDTTTTVDGREAYTVTGISGSRGGVLIAGLNALYPGASGGSDQYLFATGVPVTGFGIGFDYVNGLSGNLFYGVNGNEAFLGEYYGNTGTDRDAQFGPQQFTLTPVTTPPVTPPAVPESATWIMMILGFGGIGAALRSLRRMPQLAVA